ncbi:MAG: hypothetical protein ACRD0L_06285 [Acidimicrobiales bacterium]
MDAREITAQLQGDPALAAVLRGVLLSEDLLRLPAAMAELAESQARAEGRLADLAERQARNEDRLVQLTSHTDQLAAAMAELAERQARTEERLAQLTADVDQLAAHMVQLTTTVDRLISNVDRLTTNVDRLADRMDQLAAAMAELAQRQARTEERLDQALDDLGELKGIDLERHIREQPRRYLRHLVAGLRLLDETSLATLEADLAASGVEPAVLDDLLRADIIAEAELRDRPGEPAPPGGPIGIVIEASWRLANRDVERAARRAATMARAGRPALAVVVARQPPSPIVMQLARDNGVAVVADQEVLEAGTAH